MPTAIIVVAAILGTILIVLALIWIVRVIKFRPSKDKRAQLAHLNGLLEPCGFAYDPDGDYFYSLLNCWQRKVGYCRLYDEAAPLGNMIMHCEPIPFEYGGKRWLIELWKGQYGITTGAEIGVYNTSRQDIISDRFTGPFYENIQDSEMLRLSYTLLRNGQPLVTRRARHWWLTCFVLGDFTEPEALTLEARIGFPNRTMRDAFVQALVSIGYQSGEYQVRRKSVIIHFAQPHTKQPDSQTSLQRQIAQALNKSNCELYKTATAPYKDTLDRLEYLENMVPILFDFMLNSLYGKNVFEAFEWLVPGALPPPPPKPPKLPIDLWPPISPTFPPRGSSCACNECNPCGKPCEPE